MQLETWGDVAILRIAGTKGNSMTPEMVSALGTHVREALAGDATALVITGDGKFFSAGLALPSLIALSRADLGSFMDGFGDVMRAIFEAPKPVVAAINGHAIAGGAVLALQCDVRIAAAGSYRIGLSEAQLGIALPSVALEPLRFAVPSRSLVPVALEGRLFSPAEAMVVGLVDEVVDDVEGAAVERARNLGAVPSPAFAIAKASLRRPAVKAIERNASADGERWLDSWFSEPAQRLLHAAVAKLGG